MATGTATPAQYNTGFFSSPDDLANAAKLADDTVQSIDSQVSSASSAPAGWSTQWATFKSTWSSWYSSNFGAGELHIWREWLTSDLEGQLSQYEQQIAVWGNQAQQYGATIPGGVPQGPSNGLPDWFPSSGTVVGVLALLLGVIVAWRVL